MQINGFALVQKFDGTQVARWSSIPPRIEYPQGDNPQLRVDCAALGWEDETFRIDAVTWTVADPVPQVISDRQFFQQLAIQSVITEDEALGAVKTGTLPASIVSLVNALPSDQQFGANMLLCGATSFDRNHPMVAVLGQAFGWTDAQLDALWTAASVL